MRVIVLNINNIVQDGQNNKLVYNFPNSIDFKNKYISVQSVNMSPQNLEIISFHILGLWQQSQPYIT